MYLSLGDEDNEEGWRSEHVLELHFLREAKLLLPHDVQIQAPGSFILSMDFFMVRVAEFLAGAFEPLGVGGEELEDEGAIKIFGFLGCGLSEFCCVARSNPRFLARRVRASWERGMHSC
mgnify:FL=1